MTATWCPTRCINEYVLTRLRERTERKPPNPGIGLRIVQRSKKGRDASRTAPIRSSGELPLQFETCSEYQHNYPHTSVVPSTRAVAAPEAQVRAAR